MPPVVLGLPPGACVCTKWKGELLFQEPGVLMGSTTRPRLLASDPISCWYASWEDDWMLKSPVTMICHPAGSALASSRMAVASMSRRAWSVPTPQQPEPDFM
jgi:hypothetical protein